jgi:NAD(P)-dependent dehydrogenase (short-subunit alcohol dehydrogenase family)
MTGAPAADRAVAIVTGAAGGIGRAVVAALDEDGFFVVALDRAAGPVPGAGIAHGLDLADPQAISERFALLDAEHGTAAVLVNCAGFYEGREFLGYGPESLRYVIDANLTSTFFCTQCVVRRAIVEARTASIINVASISGQAGSPDAGYGASKGAVIALTVSLGRSLVRHGIRVNAVAPGIIDTPMAARIPPDRLAAYLAEIPSGRLGRRDEVAAAVRFLADPSSSYITGATIDVNGGLR